MKSSDNLFFRSRQKADAKTAPALMADAWRMTPGHAMCGGRHRGGEAEAGSDFVEDINPRSGGEVSISCLGHDCDVVTRKQLVVTKIRRRRLGRRCRDYKTDSRKTPCSRRILNSEEMPIVVRQPKSLVYLTRDLKYGHTKKVELEVPRSRCREKTINIVHYRLSVDPFVAGSEASREWGPRIILDGVFLELLQRPAYDILLSTLAVEVRGNIAVRQCDGLATRDIDPDMPLAKSLLAILRNQS